MKNQIRRREFMTLFGSAAAAWPLAARAQQASLPVVGYLTLGSPSQAQSALLLRAFRQGLSEMGYVEDRNVAIEYRWAGAQYDLLPALVADLVRRQVRVIATNGGTPAAQAAKEATSTVPIVFQVGADPVAQGLVTSLNRPGGNLTGVVSLNTELGPKRLEVLHEIVPPASTLAFLLDPTSPLFEQQLRNVQDAARLLGRQLHILHASSERDFEPVFASLVQMRVGGLAINNNPLFAVNVERLAALAMRQAIPAISSNRDFVMAGGLMSYGGSLTDQFRLMGNYVGRILKGEKPADLPVQQVTRVELLINMKTAKAIGLTIPEAFLLRADELIE